MTATKTETNTNTNTNTRRAAAYLFSQSDFWIGWCSLGFGRALVDAVEALLAHNRGAAAVDAVCAIVMVGIARFAIKRSARPPTT